MKNTENNPLLLMCKDNPVYDISNQQIIDEKLVPGAILRETMTFDEWMKTRYSTSTNPSARRQMLRAFSTDLHDAEVIRVTRALSLSDCYWIKQQNEDTKFNDVTPYLNKEWDGNGEFKGGSISTLFANGAANKKWLDSNNLVKHDSSKEHDAYKLCSELGVNPEYCAEARLSGENNKDLIIANFTSPESFLESAGQSGLFTENKPHIIAVDVFGERAVTLLVIDYLVECDDRYSGNFGYIRNADTGEYENMAPYYDFDWIWTGHSVMPPDNAFTNHGELIRNLCDKAKEIADKFDKSDVIMKRADELIKQVEKTCDKL